MGAARGMLAIAVAIVVVILAAPHVGIEGAQGAADHSSTQADAADPVIQGGPGGRIALNGPWTLRSDPGDSGAQRGFPNGTFTGSTVTVPDAPNAKRVTGKRGIDSFKGTVGWYSTKFTVPQPGAYTIRFESVNHRATVWVDGKQLGTHVGVYLPFEETVALAPGVEHTLVVKADWRNPAEMKREGFHRTWFNFGGINREVTIRPQTPSEITSPTVSTKLPGDGSAQVTLGAHLINHAATTRPLAITGTLVHDGQTIPVTFPTVDVPAGQTKVVSTTVSVPNAALWSPSSPNLYDETLHVGDESSYTLRTGLRELATKGRQFLLNGKPIELHGASLQEDAMGRGDAMTADDMDKVVSELKQIGANATRTQHPLDPALLERLDAAGIMVWQGIGPVDAPGNWTSITPALRARAKARALQNMYQAQSHPSVIVWNLANEVAGNDGHPGGQADYIDGMAKELHRRDPGRPVGLDVWGVHPPKVPGEMYKDIDVIGDTNYIGWYELTKAPRAQVRAAIRSHIQNFLHVFPNKVLMVTEFGAEANGQNATASPGGYRFQADLLKLHIGVYRSIPQVAGMLVWNLRDFAVSPAFAGGSIRQQVPNIHLVRGLNQKGLFTYDGRAKLAARTVAQLFGGSG